MSLFANIDEEACRRRQQRLLQVMVKHELDWIVLTSVEEVQWLTGVRFAWTFAPVAAMDRAGQVTLIAPNKLPPAAAADRVETYEAKWHSTLRNDQRQAASDRLVELLPAEVWKGTIGFCFSTVGGYLISECSGTLVDIEHWMYQLRRHKESDELARLRTAIAATGKMYETAREIIRPGVSEIEVFNALQSTAVTCCDEMLTGTGNDYQCGSRGGPPRGGRRAESGELYILDLGPAFQGYFADNARTIAVDRVADDQQEAWIWIMRAFEHVEQNARPGKSCAELFHEVQGILDQAPVGVFNHHLGHGIGLFPHETPHLNPNWDDTFEVGDVFTAEPGLYADALRHGMRIENDYLVTENGVENLSPFPMELKL